MIDSASAPKTGARKRSSPSTVVWLGLFIAISLTAIVLRLSHHEVAWRTPDEKVYVRFATEIARSGIDGVRTLVQSYNGDPQQWFYPPPFRISHSLLVAGLMKLSGAPAEQVAVAVSGAFSILAFFLVAWLGLRFFDRWAVLAGLALLSVNPLDLAIARRAWQDSMWGCLGLLLFYFCVEASVSSRPKLWRTWFWVSAPYFLLIKESAVIVYGFCSLWLAGSVWWQERSLAKCLRIMLMSAGVMAATVAFLSWCSGGPSALAKMFQHTALSQEANEYLRLYNCGPWHSFLTGFWVMTPMTTMLCIAGVVAVIVPRRLNLDALELDGRRRQIGWAMVSLIFTLILVLTISANLKNLRYVTVLFGPCSLLAGVGAMHLLARAKSNLPVAGHRLAVATLVIFLGLTCVTDYLRFERVFLRYGLDDLAIVRVINYAFAAGSNAEKAPRESMASANMSFVSPPASPLPASAEDYLFLCNRFYDQGRYGDAIKAAEDAIKLKPAFAEAYNNIAVAYASMEKWDEAIQASRQALRLKPDFPLARNNLAWAEQEKAKQVKKP